MVAEFPSIHKPLPPSQRVRKTTDNPGITTDREGNSTQCSNYPSARYKAWYVEALRAHLTASNQLPGTAYPTLTWQASTRHTYRPEPRQPSTPTVSRPTGPQKGITMYGGALTGPHPTGYSRVRTHPRPHTHGRTTHAHAGTRATRTHGRRAHGRPHTPTGAFHLCPRRASGVAHRACPLALPHHRPGRRKMSGFEGVCTQT